MKRLILLVVGVAVVSGIGPSILKDLKRISNASSPRGPASRSFLSAPGMSREQLAKLLANDAPFARYPEKIRMEAGPELAVKYTFNGELQAEMEALFKQARPDFGAFVAVEADTGRILSMVSYANAKNVPAGLENLALRSSFPSASVFKVVTAAAAIETKKYTSETVIPFNGRNHTLYKGNILTNKITRYTQFPTLKDAFAKSINTVFGKIGAFAVGPSELRAYADRFGFNRRIASQLPMGEGKALIPEDPWGIAEAASGYTRFNTMSPLQGALIAASIANDGVMMEPYVIEQLHKEDGSLYYEAEPAIATRAVDAPTAFEVRKLMAETVAKGTSRDSFRRFGASKKLAALEVGGKTGTLSGKDPVGKYDWFVGFARAPGTGKKIAVAALTIHRDQWRVKSSYIARRAFESLFQ